MATYTRFDSRTMPYSTLSMRLGARQMGMPPEATITYMAPVTRELRRARHIIEFSTYRICGSEHRLFYLRMNGQGETKQRDRAYRR